ncbi:hypothetical protein Tco_0465110, partial [Tanacetum coccineum]
DHLVCNAGIGSTYSSTNDVTKFEPVMDLGAVVPVMEVEACTKAIVDGVQSSHFSCSSTRSSIQVIWRPDPTKDIDTTQPDTNFVLTSGAIRGRNGPQGLEEPMSDEILREMCDKNYHQLLPLIAEKMQKEKEQKDKLNANLEEGTETGIPEAHHRTSVYSKDSRRTDPLHRSPGRGKKEACLIGWEERSQLHPHVLIVYNGEVPEAKRTEVAQE